MLSVTPQERLALGVTVLLLAAGAGARALSPGPGSVQWIQNASPASDTQVDDPRATRVAAEKALAREKCSIRVTRSVFGSLVMRRR